MVINRIGHSPARRSSDRSTCSSGWWSARGRTTLSPVSSAAFSWTFS